MDIYTYPKSRSIRATWMAEELGLDYQCHFTDVMSAEKQVPGKTRKSRHCLITVWLFLNPPLSAFIWHKPTAMAAFTRRIRKNRPS
ncbi:hypothetical protein AAFX43_10790 [Morganella morganii]